MALDPGTALGPYTVTAQIGAGGMGEVYRARDARPGAPDRLAIHLGEVRQPAATWHHVRSDACIEAGLLAPTDVGLLQLL